MRKLIMKMSMSLDGFVGDMNGTNDWVFKTGDEQSLAWSVGAIREAGLILIGRMTFEKIGPYWQTATGPFAAPMNEIPKATFTRKGFAGIPPGANPSPAEVSWAGARVFDGDLAEDIRKLKEEPGKPIVAIGGAGFMQSLISTGLIDEYWLAVHPVALGSGLPVFSKMTNPLYLELADVKTFPKGITVYNYRSLKQGNFQ